MLVRLLLNLQCHLHVVRTQQPGLFCCTETNQLRKCTASPIMQLYLSRVPSLTALRVLFPHFVIPKTEVSRVSDLHFQERRYQQLLQAGTFNFIKGCRIKDNHLSYSLAIAWNKFSDMAVGKYWFKCFPCSFEWQWDGERVWNRCITWTESSNW